MSKPRVLIFGPLLLGASETFVRAQGEGLREFEPHYVGCRFVPGLELPAGRAHVVNTGGPLGTAKEALYKFTGIAPRLYAKLRRLDPLLIHAHFGIGGVLALPLARRLGVPLIVTFHGMDATAHDDYNRRASHSHRIYLRRRDALKREATHVIAVSGFIRDRLVAQGFPPEKITVHYIGIDTDFFRPDAALATRASREPVVLFVGRLAEKKGCEYLIRAMARVRDRVPAARLRIIGDGPLRSSLETLARDVLPDCEFRGAQPPEVVRREMGRAAVFSVPSVVASSGDAEGFGLVFAEAQAMGTPVVSFATGGIPEAVAHARTGLLAAERDVDGLAEAIVTTLTDDGAWQRMSEAAQARVRAEFDLRRQTRVLEQIYRTVAGAAAGGRTVNKNDAAAPRADAAETALAAGPQTG